MTTDKDLMFEAVATNSDKCRLGESVAVSLEHVLLFLISINTAGSTV